jgi:hypothetical protein
MRARLELSKRDCAELIVGRIIAKANPISNDLEKLANQVGNEFRKVFDETLARKG